MSQEQALETLERGFSLAATLLNPFIAAMAAHNSGRATRIDRPHVRLAFPLCQSGPLHGVKRRFAAMAHRRGCPGAGSGPLCKLLRPARLSAGPHGDDPL